MSLAYYLLTADLYIYLFAYIIIILLVLLRCILQSG